MASFSVPASSVEEELMCPVCLQMPRLLPIPCCPRGHLLCRLCWNNLDNSKCPTCRCDMGDNVSTVAGALVLKIPHPCRFTGKGCDIRMMLTEIMEHEKNCSFRGTETVGNTGTNRTRPEVRRERVQHQRPRHSQRQRQHVEEEGIGLGTGLLMGAGIVAAGLGILHVVKKCSEGDKQKK
jgi:hypothetical protein